MKDKNINQDYPSRKLICMGYEELRGYVINNGESILRKPAGINLFYRCGMFGWLAGRVQETHPAAAKL